MPWLYAIEGVDSLAVRRESGPPWESRLQIGDLVGACKVLTELEVSNEIAEQVGSEPRRFHITDDGKLVESKTGETLEIPETVQPVPESVFMFQLRKAMRRTDVVEGYPEGGDALSSLETYAKNANDPDLADELSAPSVRRDHVTVEKLRRLFRWSHEQVDALFRLATTQ